jgi:hypothetical protein
VNPLSLYGRVLAAYSGHGSLRLETGETLRCAFTVGQLADGGIILLTHALAGSISWPPGPLASFEGTTPQGEHSSQTVEGSRSRIFDRHLWSRGPRSRFTCGP